MLAIYCTDIRGADERKARQRPRSVEADTGEDALEKLRDNPDIGVALLDVMLPGIDGFEVCRRIRASSAKTGIRSSIRLRSPRPKWRTKSLPGTGPCRDWT